MRYFICLRPHPRTFLFALVAALLLSLAPATLLAQGGLISYGDTVQGSLTAQAPVAFYTFTGEEDDLVTLTVIGTTPGFRPTLTLLSAATGQLAFSGGDPLTALPGDATITQRLPQTGAYSILLGGNPVPGDYILFLSAEPPETGITVNEDTPAEVEVQPQTAQVFEVAGDPAQTVFVRFTADPATFDFTVYVRNPDGRLIATLDGSIVQNSALALAPTTGTYRLRVVPNGPAAGSVSLTVGQAATEPAVDGTQEPPEPVATEEVAPGAGTPIAVSATATEPAVDACRVALTVPVTLYAGPGTDFEVVGEIEPNTFYLLEARANLDADALGGNSDWFGIAYEDETGEMITAWLAFTAFIIEGDCTDVPTYVYEVTPEPPVATEEVAPTETVDVTATATATVTSTVPGQPTQPGPTATSTPSYTPTAPAAATPTAPQVEPTATFTPSFTPTAPVTATFTPSYTPTTPPPPQIAPEDARFNAPLAIPLDNTVSVLDFVSYPDGDREDRVRYSVTGMNNNSALSGGRARLVIAVSCFGTNTNQVEFFTGGQTYTCGQTLVDREVTADSDTGSIVITAIGGEGTYVQWVLTGTATRIN